MQSRQKEEEEEPSFGAPRRPTLSSTPRSLEEDEQPRFGLN